MGGSRMESRCGYRANTRIRIWSSMRVTMDQKLTLHSRTSSTNSSILEILGSQSLKASRTSSGVPTFWFTPSSMRTSQLICISDFVTSIHLQKDGLRKNKVDQGFVYSFQKIWQDGSMRSYPVVVSRNRDKLFQFWNPFQLSRRYGNAVNHLTSWNWRALCVQNDVAGHWMKPVWCNDEICTKLKARSCLQRRSFGVDADYSVVQICFNTEVGCAFE